MLDARALIEAVEQLAAEADTRGQREQDQFDLKGGEFIETLRAHKS